MLRDAFVVFRKELKEILRDRKTLVFMLLLPVVMVPLIIDFTADFMADVEQKAASKTLTYVVQGAELTPGLEDALRSAGGFEPTELAGLTEEQIDAEIEAGRLDFALVMREGEGDQRVAELHFDNAQMMSKVKSRVEDALEGYNTQVRDQRLAKLGLATPQAREAVLTPVELVERGIAEIREVLGEAIGGFLPYILIPFAFMGALYPAIDLGAGEKERGTLETLLLAPVSRAALVVGKFLVIFVAGLTSALLTVGSLGVWLSSRSETASGVLKSVLETIGWADLALVAAMLLPLTAVFASLLLSISIYAKSFKEAQSYATPLNFLVIIPAFISLLPGIELDWTWAMVPISNVSLALKELVKGTMDPLMLVVILASSMLLAAVLLLFCIRWFQREDVLFRQ